MSIWASTWGACATWSFRIVRAARDEPVVWHFIVDDPDDAIEVTQCSDGSLDWIDLTDVRDLFLLGQVCPRCAQHLGWFAQRCTQEEQNRGR